MMGLYTYLTAESSREVDGKRQGGFLQVQGCGVDLCYEGSGLSLNST